MQRDCFCRQIAVAGQADADFHIGSCRQCRSVRAGKGQAHFKQLVAIGFRDDADYVHVFGPSIVGQDA